MFTTVCLQVSLAIISGKKITLLYAYAIDSDSDRGKKACQIIVLEKLG